MDGQLFAGAGRPHYLGAVAACTGNGHGGRAVRHGQRGDGTAGVLLRRLIHRAGIRGAVPGGDQQRRGCGHGLGTVHGAIQRQQLYRRGGDVRKTEAKRRAGVVAGCLRHTGHGGGRIHHPKRGAEPEHRIHGDMGHGDGRSDGADDAHKHRMEGNGQGAAGDAIQPDRRGRKGADSDGEHNGGAGDAGRRGDRPGGRCLCPGGRADGGADGRKTVCAAAV